MPCFFQICTLSIGLAYMKSSHQHFTDREQQEHSNSSLKGLPPSPEFPSSLGNAVRAPPPVTNLPVTTQALSNLQVVSITKGKCPLQHVYCKIQMNFFPHQCSFFLYPETRPLTADTVLIFLFSVIPSVAAVSGPLYFKAVKLMLKKAASVPYELSQASFSTAVNWFRGIMVKPGNFTSKQNHHSRSSGHDFNSH